MNRTTTLFNSSILVLLASGSGCSTSGSISGNGTSQSAGAGGDVTSGQSSTASAGSSSSAQTGGTGGATAGSVATGSGATASGTGGGGTGGGGGGQAAKPLQPSGPITIDGKSNVTITGLHITSNSGPCLVISKASQVTIEGCEIGPCDGNAIHVADSDQITITDSYVHSEFQAKSCCDTGDGIFIERTTNLLAQGNVIAFGESNIEAQEVMHLHVVSNFLLNPSGPFPRGQNVQVWGQSSDVTVENNYALSSEDPKYIHGYNQEDSVNFGFTDGIVAKNNYISGGKSPSGCGLIADEAANGAQFLDNVLVDTGQCGIGIASGTNQVINHNQIINSTPIANGGNTGLVVWKQYTDACGPVSVTNNVSSELKPDMVTESGYWNGGGCEPVTLTSNVWDAAARAMLTPVAQKLPPPSIPPAPVHCVAPAPWVNYVGMPACGGP